VFGGTLNLAQSVSLVLSCAEFLSSCKLALHYGMWPSCIILPICDNQIPTVLLFWLPLCQRVRVNNYNVLPIISWSTFLWHIYISYRICADCLQYGEIYILVDAWMYPEGLQVHSDG